MSLFALLSALLAHAADPKSCEEQVRRYLDRLETTDDLAFYEALAAAAPRIERESRRLGLSIHAPLAPKASAADLDPAFAVEANSDLALSPEFEQGLEALAWAKEHAASGSIAAAFTRLHVSDPKRTPLTLLQGLAYIQNNPRAFGLPHHFTLDIDDQSGRRSNEIPTPLITALESGNYLLALNLLDLGANPNQFYLKTYEDEDDFTHRYTVRTTPLSIAARDFKAPLQIFSKLISKGADLNDKETTGPTILFHLKSKEKALIELFLKNGVSPSAVDDLGNSVVFNIEYPTETLRLLLNQGHPLEHRNNIDQTALMRKVWYDLFDEVEVLIDHGADVLAVDKNGHSSILQLEIKARNPRKYWNEAKRAKLATVLEKARAQAGARGPTPWEIFKADAIFKIKGLL